MSHLIIKIFLLATLLTTTTRGLKGQDNNEGLNTLLNFPLWMDSSLWDDKADFTARRLDLQGTVNSDRSFYRGTPHRSTECLGAKLYVVDLYGQSGLVQRVVLGFVNRADLSAQSASTNPRAYETAAETDFTRIRTRLISRLGQPTQGTSGESWSWVGHELLLNKGPEALTLTIQKARHAPNASPESLLQEKQIARNPPSHYVKRNGTGDVYIQGMPPISQGNRNYCVPASWEKALRHLGLGLNVYDLAQKGGTQVDGTLYLPFAKEMENLLKPLRYEVKYIRQSENDLAAIKPYINQGLPVVWCMNANCLPDWVQRTESRTNRLPSARFSTKNRPPAPHALLIIGYNEAYQEIALSDSTELGSSTLQIWISTSEMLDAELGNTPKTVVVPPNAPLQSGGFVKPKWY